MRGVELQGRVGGLSLERQRLGREPVDIALQHPDADLDVADLAVERGDGGVELGSAGPDLAELPERGRLGCGGLADGLLELGDPRRGRRSGPPAGATRGDQQQHRQRQPQFHMRIVGNTNPTNNTGGAQAASVSTCGAGIPLRSECDPKITRRGSGGGR